MPVDNTVYDRMADSWWEEGGFLHALAALRGSANRFAGLIAAAHGLEPGLS